MIKKLGIILLTLMVLMIGLILGKLNTKKQIVFINEVRSWNDSAMRDGYYGSDYIELYNNSDDAVSLNGWYISDDANDLKKCQIYDVVVEGKGFTLLYANEKNDSGASLNFKLNSKGERIYLSDAQGILVDSVYIPKQEFGTVYARLTDGATEWCVKEESTDFSNNDAKILPVKTLEEPVFSHVSGFYEEPFTLELMAGENETIYYTLDGSQPTTDSEIYENGIYIENISDQPNVVTAVRNVITDWGDYTPSDKKVDKAVIVRAVAFDEYNRASEVITHTYFVELEQYKDQNIISVVADYDDLFGEEGIFVTGKEYDQAYLNGHVEDMPIPNFVQSGRRWEVLGNIQFFNEGHEICNQKTGIRTYGGSSRQDKFKRMSFYARNCYSGIDYFEGILFDGRKVKSMGTNIDEGNLILPQLVTDRAVDVQGAARTIIFLNGEYYSSHSVMEKYTSKYFTEKYNLKEDNIMVIRDGEISMGTWEQFNLYQWLLKEVATKDMSIQENYDEVSTLMDIQSYIDYICANVYLCNMDVSDVKNYMLWRCIEPDGSTYGDGKFRWMLYDMGALDGQISKRYYEVESAAQVNSFSTKGRYVGHAINEEIIYKALINNSSYRKQFVLSFMDMANVNFELNNVKKVFEQWGCSIDRFGDFFEKRFDYIVPYMAEEFGLTGTLENVTLKINDSNTGQIKINTTIPNLETGSWTGKYYTDYPVTVTAQAADGYRFVGWTGNVESQEPTIEAEVLHNGIVLEAVFEKIEK